MNHVVPKVGRYFIGTLLSTWNSSFSSTCLLGYQASFWIVSVRAVNILVPFGIKISDPSQFKISLLSLSLPAIEMEAVKNLVNHQYILRVTPWRARQAFVNVPKIVKIEARVVRSSLSHAAKKDCRNPKEGVDCPKSSRIVLVVKPPSSDLISAASLRTGGGTMMKCG